MPEWGRYDQAKADIDIAVETAARTAADTAEVTARNAAIVTHAADLDAHINTWDTIWRTGEYIAPLPWINSDTSALVADTIYATPFLVARNLTIDRLAIEVTVLASGAIARLGIYADGTNLYPGALVLDAATVSVATTGVKVATISQALTKGLYWLVVVSDGAPTIRHWLVSWSPLGMTATGFYLTQMQGGWTKAAVGSGALADPFVSDGSLKIAAVPAVMPRLLTLD